MKNAFDKSDIYIICRMTPLTYGISRCEDEIAQCEWMKLSTLLTHTDTGPMSRLAARLASHGTVNPSLGHSNDKPVPVTVAIFSLFYRDCQKADWKNHKATCRVSKGHKAKSDT